MREEGWRFPPFPFAAGAQPGRERRPLRWIAAADGIKVLVWVNSKRRKRKGTAAPKGESDRGTVGREVKVGVVGLLDEGGRVVRGSQWYEAMLASALVFRPRLRQVAEARGVRVIDEVVVLSDAANWLPALGTRHFPEATAIRDFFHAVEHLGVMGEALYGHGEAKASRWQGEMAHRLKAQGAAALVAELEQMPSAPQDNKDWRRELNYFRRNQKEMDYPRFRERGLPIGSGSAEGGCKYVVGERFKLPGARWTVEGLQNLLPLRVAYCNGVSVTS